LHYFAYSWCHICIPPVRKGGDGHCAECMRTVVKASVGIFGVVCNFQGIQAATVVSEVTSAPPVVAHMLRHEAASN
jgi:hypothetical protein